jgi:hypothetical protein
VTVFTYTWNATFLATPADTEDESLGAQRIRDTKAAVGERLAVDHAMAGDPNDGKHLWMTLRNRGSVTAAPLDANDGFVFGSQVAGNTELFYQDSLGRVIQLTNGGILAANTSYLPLAGGTLTGPLTLSADPAASLQPVTLQYFQANQPAPPPIASNNLPQMDGTAAAGTGPAWSRDDHVHPSDTSRAPLVSPAFTGSPTAPTASIGDSSTLVATTRFVTTAGNAFVPLAGGVTMTGLLVLSADPAAPLGAASKQYVDNHQPLGGPYLPLAGGVITGNIGFHGAAAAAKPTVTGAKNSNVALGSLMAALVAYGLVIDSTTT